ncbi:hypothetical protein K0M31_003021, partial [Melipona bicolor]
DRQNLAKSNFLTFSAIKISLLLIPEGILISSQFEQTPRTKRGSTKTISPPKQSPEPVKQLASVILANLPSRTTSRLTRNQIIDPGSVPP